MISPLKQRYLMCISYIGTGFRGSQIQYETPEYMSNTIQGSVSAALTELLKYSEDNLITTYFTSRTDAGVHAFMNGVHFDLPKINGRYLGCNFIKNALNKKFTREDVNIRVSKVLKVPEIFHARYSAYEKTYIYRIAVPKNYSGEKYEYPVIEINRTHFLRCEELDLDIIQELENLYVGEKDFATFGGKASKNQRPTICKLISFKISRNLPFMQDWYSSPLSFDYYHFTCVGNKFLYHMVRRLVGVALAVGQHRISLPEVKEMFDKPGASSWHRKAEVVPGWGLYLADIKFQPDHLIFNEEKEEEGREKEKEKELPKEKIVTSETKSFSKFREFLEKTSHITNS